MSGFERGWNLLYMHEINFFFKIKSPCNASVQGRPRINAKPLHTPSTHIGTTNVDATDTLEAVTS